MRQFNDGVQITEYDDLNDIIARFDNLIDDAPDTEIKRITLMNQLHAVAKKSPYVIGHLVVEQERILKVNYENWKQLSGKTGDPPISELTDWFSLHKSELKFDYPQALKYKRSYEYGDREIVDKLGVTKINELRKLPEEKRGKIQSAAIENNWSVSKIKEEIKAEEHKVERRAEIEKEKKKADRNIGVNVKLTSDRSITVTLDDKECRDKFNLILLNMLTDIKLRMKRLLDSEET